MNLRLRRRRRDREAELEEDIQSHLQMAARERMERGESAERAAWEARREFGNVGLIKETTRGIWGFGALEAGWQDLRYGTRMLVQNPGFTVLAILTLSLGIGANTAIFSLINALLLRPPLAAQPEQMVRLDKLERGIGNHTSYLNYRDLVEGTRSFSALAAFSGGPLNLGEGEAMGRVWSQSVTGNYFPAFGIRAALGRTFGTETDGEPGAYPVAVVSHGLWERRFGADPALVGRTVILNGRQFTVIGIMPKGFRGAWPLGLSPEIWTPLTMHQQLKPGADLFGDRGHHWVQVLGRLKLGVSQAEAQAEIDLVTRRLVRDYPKENQGLENARAYPMLALAGGVAGCLLAFCAAVLLRSFALPTSIPIEFDVVIDGRVLCFTLAVSVLSGLLFGLVPVRHASKLDLVSILKDDRRSTGGKVKSFSLRSLLVISQVAVSLLFLICAGLCARSLQQANSVDPGFETDRALTVPLDLEPAGYDEARGRLFYRQLLDRVERMPGAQSATLARSVPARRNNGGASEVIVEGDNSANTGSINLNSVAPRYFETMGITILASTSRMTQGRRSS